MSTHATIRIYMIHTHVHVFTHMPTHMPEYTCVYTHCCRRLRPGCRPQPCSTYLWKAIPCSNYLDCHIVSTAHRASALTLAAVSVTLPRSWTLYPAELDPSRTLSSLAAVSIVHHRTGALGVPARRHGGREHSFVRGCAPFQTHRGPRAR